MLPANPIHAASKLPKRHLNLDYGSNAFKPKSDVAKGIMDVTMEVNEKVIYLWQQK